VKRKLESGGRQGGLAGRGCVASVDALSAIRNGDAPQRTAKWLLRCSGMRRAMHYRRSGMASKMV